MANLAPIGSVVRIGEFKFYVIGHRMARDADNVGPCYILVPYPLGFINAGSLSLTPISEVGEVVDVGYMNGAGDEYLLGLAKLIEETVGIGYDDYADALVAMKNYMEEEGGTRD